MSSFATRRSPRNKPGLRASWTLRVQTGPARIGDEAGSGEGAAEPEAVPLFEEPPSPTAIPLCLHDRRGLLIKLYTGRINHRGSVSRGKPEPAVAPLPTRRLAAAVAFQSEQAIVFSASDRSKPASLSIGKIIQLLALDPIDSPVATHPEITAPIFQNLEHAVVEETIFRGVTGKAAILEAAEATIISADPENPVSIFIERSDVIARQSILFGVGPKLALSVAGESAPGSEPELAGAILHNCFHLIAGQAVLRGIASVAATLIFDETLTRAKPKMPCPVLVNDPNCVTEKAIGVGICGQPAVPAGVAIAIGQKISVEATQA